MDRRHGALSLAGPSMLKILAVSVLLSAACVVASTPCLAQDFNNWEEFASWCTSTGGTPLPDPPRCVPPSSGAASAGANPAVQGAAAIGAAIGNAIVRSVEMAALHRQEAAELRSREEANMAAEHAQQARHDARLKQQEVNSLAGTLKFSSNDPQLNGAQTQSAQLNPGATTAAARALRAVPNEGAIPSATAMGQLSNSASETTGQLFDNGLGQSDARPAAVSGGLAAPAAVPVEAVREDVFPGLSQADWGRLEGSKEGGALIQHAQGLLAERDALDQKVDTLRQQSNPSAQAQHELISAIHKQADVKNQLSALQPQAQQLIYRAVLDK